MTDEMVPHAKHDSFPPKRLPQHRRERRREYMADFRRMSARFRRFWGALGVELPASTLGGAAGDAGEEADGWQSGRGRPMARWNKVDGFMEVYNTSCNMWQAAALPSVRDLPSDLPSVRPALLSIPSANHTLRDLPDDLPSLGALPGDVPEAQMAGGYGRWYRMGYTGDDGKEYLAEEDVKELNAMRLDEGKRPLSRDEWQVEYPRLRQVV
jgi:hypothetical protein